MTVAPPGRDGCDTERRRLRLRLRIKTTIAIVAALGFLLAAGREIYYRQERDRAARSESQSIEQALLREREGIYCRKMLKAGKLYPINERSRYLAESHIVFFFDIEFNQFKSWGDELYYHDDTAPRYREQAAKATLRKHEAERHLTFP